MAWVRVEMETWRPLLFFLRRPLVICLPSTHLNTCPNCYSWDKKWLKELPEAVLDVLYLHKRVGRIGFYPLLFTCSHSFQMLIGLFALLSPTKCCFPEEVSAENLGKSRGNHTLAWGLREVIFKIMLSQMPDSDPPASSLLLPSSTFLVVCWIPRVKVKPVTFPPCLSSTPTAPRLD